MSYCPLPSHDSLPSIGTDEPTALEKTNAAYDPALRYDAILKTATIKQA
jgi:hypothetical protein